MAAALFQGASIGPLIDLAIEVDPRYCGHCLVGSYHVLIVSIAVLSSKCLVSLLSFILLDLASTI